jgi:hypothetical protein
LIPFIFEEDNRIFFCNIEVTEENIIVHLHYRKQPRRTEAEDTYKQEISTLVIELITNCFTLNILDAKDDLILGVTHEEILEKEEDMLALICQKSEEIILSTPVEMSEMKSKMLNVITGLLQV